MKIEYLIIWSVICLASTVIGAEFDASRASAFSKSAAQRIEAGIDKNLPGSALKDRSQRRVDMWLNGVPEPGEEDGKKKTEATILNYGFQSKEEKGFLTLTVYDTVEDAVNWYQFTIRGFPVDYVQVAQLGHEAVRFPKADPDRTGTLLMRRGAIVVQVNVERTHTALKLAN